LIDFGPETTRLSDCNCSTHPLISKYLIHNDSFGRYAAAQQQRRFRCSVEGKY
jgi:hypothetical protein